MKRFTTTFLLLILLFSFKTGFSQTCNGETLNNSEITGTAAFCSDTGITFCNSLADGSTNPATYAAPGPYYDCLTTQPYPSWFFIRIDNPGSLDLTIIQKNLYGYDIDVDFIIWGPYTDTQIDNIRGGDYSLLDQNSVKDCSFLPDATEYLHVNPVINDEYYVILVTNYQQEPGTIQMENSNSSNGATTDCSIISATLGLDRKVCEGTNITLDASNTNVTVVEYKWFLDTGAGFSEISGQNGATLLIDTNISGTYKVEIKDDTGNVGDDEVNITYFPNPIANTVDDILYCDPDNDGFYTFDLNQIVTPLVLNGQDPNQFEVVYYQNAADANSNVSGNALPNSYTNPTAFGTQQIFARIHNKAAPTACFEVVPFIIGVSSAPVPSQPTDYIVCDDMVSGSDTDGIYNNFTLSTKDSEVLGSLSSSQYTVSYHTTLVGAQTNATTDVIDKIAPYTNSNASLQTIYVRIENTLNADCSVVSDPNSANFKPFNLIVNSLPTVSTPVELKQCDTDSDLITSLNLTLAEQNLSANHSNETFTYYPTQNDAINNTNSITNTTNYQAANGDIIWVRIQNNQQCYRISSIDIVVGYASNVNYNHQFYECDDYLDIDGNDNGDSNSNTDGVTNFDLSAVIPEVKLLFPVNVRPDLNVLVFESDADRNILKDPIANLSSYRNKNLPALTPQSLYIKIINSLNNECVGLGEFTILTGIPEANFVDPIILCDDKESGSSADGENININLTSTINGIIGSQTPNNVTVTFHTNFNDALTGSNVISNDTSYRNTAPSDFVEGSLSVQTIYVRVKDNTTNCVNPNTVFDIIINPVPELTTNIPAIELCDSGSLDNDTRNGLEQNIDLSQRAQEILNGRDASIYEVNFHKLESDSYTATNPVAYTYHMDPTTTTITNSVGEDILWVSVLNRNTGCVTGGEKLPIIAYPEPNIPNTIQDYIACDTDNNNKGSDTDGILENINLSSKISEILVNYQATDFSNFQVSFHNNSSDASTGNAPINPTLYTNINNPETIFVRVVDKASGCYNASLSFNIIINELPEFTLNSPQIVCLNNTPLTIYAENPKSNDYLYEWNLKGQSGVLGQEISLEVYNRGTYTLTAINSATGCSRTKEIVVTPSVIASLNEEDITIIDDTNNGNYETHSIIINNNDDNLGIGDYEFALRYENGDETFYQDEPIFTNLEGGIYTVLVQDKNNCGIASVEVALVQFPKYFTPNDDGYNDTWIIKGINNNFFPKSELMVFDRFGKLLFKQPVDQNLGWDGTYNGTVLPSSDYWFKILLTDKNGKTYINSGNFSLLRK